MGIRIRISMAGKMFGGCSYTCLLKSSNGCRTEVSYLFRGFPEGTHANDRVARIIVHVEYGCKVHVDAHRF
ncbi:hypothetical protein D3C75_1268280 [compost metagenome]